MTTVNPTASGSARYRRILVKLSGEALLGSEDYGIDPKILKRWSRNNLIVLALCGAVGLMGFAMQLLGAATSIAFTLYIIAIAYLFLLRPAKP